MIVYCYILRLQDKTYYCGITKQIEIRIVQHNKGECVSTRKKLPAVIVWIKEFEGYKSARAIERKIKSQGVRRWYLKNVRGA